MFSGAQNSKGHIKDEEKMPSIYTPSRSYSKFIPRSKKLVTALYMVTDIMDSSEPMRSKLRFLGAEVLSDIYGNSRNILTRIDEIVSFLDICFTLDMISEMNSNILKREFLNLKHSIIDSTKISSFWEDGKTLADFINTEDETEQNSEEKTPYKSIGQFKTTKIGVQRAGTLMKALSDRIGNLSDKGQGDRDVLKKQRQDEIINIIKSKASSNGQEFKGLTITDIKTEARGVLSDCGEKTIQRELVSMVKDNVLRKVGEKRWSRYFLTQP